MKMGKLCLNGFTVHYITVSNSIRTYITSRTTRRASNGRCYLRSLRMLGNVSEFHALHCLLH